MRSVLLASLVIFAAGCASQDMRILSQLEPGPDGSFVFRSFADAIYGLKDEKSEQLRLGELNRRLKLNELCPKGHTIDRRQAVLVSEGGLGNLYDLFYYGRCK